ncbi:MAG: hypothetical protein QOI58_14 [Thermoanaerobaculia bacterium]|jgi:hypothetical protein|nr:hypothetical protein [Thermoanaerobaculia bacterium]
MSKDLFNGLIVWIVCIAVILAPVYMFLIRRRVGRYMRQRVRRSATTMPAVERQGGAPLQLANEAAPRTPISDAGRVPFERMRNVRRSAAAIYFLAGVAAASVLAAGEYAADSKWRPLMVIYLWPAVLTVSTAAVPSLRKRALVLGVAFLALFGTLAAARVDGAVIGDFIRFLLPPTMLLLLVGNRALRTLAPVLVLIGLVVAGALLVFLVGGSYGSVFAVLVSGLLSLALLPWAYERKYFSELSFQLAFIWVVFAAAYGMKYETAHFWRYGAASLAVYAGLTRLMLPVLRRAARKHRPASLLVLRVFGSAGRSTRLLEHIGMRWRTVGPIHLIAGADTAITNLDLSEVFRFLTFRFRSEYVKDAADLERRLEKLDCAPDPDGRYRVNDFFCFDDTWKATFTALLHRSDVILLDLSGFGPKNAGVAFELGHLLGSRPLGSFVLITDRKTDIDYLGATLTRIWRQLDPSAPNAALEHPVLRVLRDPPARRLVAALCDAAVAG